MAEEFTSENAGSDTAQIKPEKIDEAGLIKMPWGSVISMFHLLEEKSVYRLATLLKKERRFTHALTLLLYYKRTVESLDIKNLNEILSCARSLGYEAFAREIALEGMLRWPDEYCFREQYGFSSWRLGLLAGLENLALNLTVHPDERGHGWRLLAQLYMTEKRWAEAAVAFEKAAELLPRNLHVVRSYVIALNNAGLQSTACTVLELKKDMLSDQADILQELQTVLAQKSSSPQERLYPASRRQVTISQLQRRIGDAARKKDFAEVLELARQAFSLDGEDFEIAKKLIAGLIFTAHYDEARDILIKLQRNLPEFRSTIVGMHALLEMMRGNSRLGASLCIAEINHVKTGVEHIYELAMYYKRLGRFQEAIEVLQNAHHEDETDSTSRWLAISVAEVELAAGNFHRCMNILTELRLEMGDEHFDTAYARFASWYEMQRGDVVRARELFDERAKQHPPAPMQTNSPPREIKSAKSEIIGKQQILLFAIFKNERKRMPTFLAYYRKLGVEVFYICDNGSSDGTLEYLLDQDDVRLFQSTASFSTSAFGVTWIQYLINKYAEDQWVVVVDADELLVYPQSETVPLPVLTRYLERSGYDALGSFMLDMYAENMSQSEIWEGVRMPYDVCRYFDNTYTIYHNLDAPYFQVSGGFRDRIVGDGAGLGIPLVKTPLIKAGRGIDFIIATHNVSPCKVGDIRSVLLHFKFIGDTESYLKKQIEDGFHFANAHAYRPLQDWYESITPQTSLLVDESVEFESSQTLLDRGIIKTSPQYEEFVTQCARSTSDERSRLCVVQTPGACMTDLVGALRGCGFLSLYNGHETVLDSLGLKKEFRRHDFFIGYSVINYLEKLHYVLPTMRFVYVRQDALKSVNDLIQYSTIHFGCPLIEDVFRTRKRLQQIQAVEEKDVEARLELLEFASFLAGATSWEEAIVNFEDRIDAMIARAPDRFLVLTTPYDKRKIMQYIFGKDSSSGVLFDSESEE